MTEDTSEDLQPLLGAVGPYLGLTTGPDNPFEEFADDAEEFFHPEDFNYFWEDEEQ